jgi:RNA recognition motif-containing protein
VSSSASFVKSSKKTFNNTDLHLFVGNLATETDEKSLTKYFSRFGEIEDVHVPRTANGNNRRFGYITFNRLFDKSPLWQRHNIDGS